MNTWLKIKQNIYEDKLNEIDGLFNVKESHAKWSSDLQSWAYRQKFNNYNSLALSLAECNEVKRNLDRINEELFYEIKNVEVVCQLKEEFKKYYKILLDQKEHELKLEVAAELVEEKKVPLDIFAEWYQENKHLPQREFKEALGEFWGDVWRHAKHGAGAGALGGGAAAGLGTGGLGTFAGAGLGGLVGGLGGGIYGAGKHLLRKVWDWRKNQTEFEKTKKDAYNILKKLKGDSSQFELDPNFHELLDAMIQKLGATKAYKLNTPKPAEALPATAPTQAPQAQVEPAKAAVAPSGPAHVMPPTGSGTQSVAAPPTDIGFQGDTGGVSGTHVADVGAGIGVHDLPGGGTPAKKKRVRKETPTEAPAAPTEKSIESKEDVIKYLHDGDEKELETRLIKLGLALNLVGDPQDKDDYNAIDFDILKHGLMHDVTGIPPEEKEAYKNKAIAYQNFLAKPEEVKPAETKPAETKPIPGQPAAYVKKEDPVSMSYKDFKNFLKSKGMDTNVSKKEIGAPDSDERLTFMQDNGVLEAVSKYKNLLKQDIRPVFVEHKIGSLCFKDRVQFYKDSLRKLP